MVLLGDVRLKSFFVSDIVKNKLCVAGDWLCHALRKQWQWVSGCLLAKNPYWWWAVGREPFRAREDAWKKRKLPRALLVASALCLRGDEDPIPLVQFACLPDNSPGIVNDVD